MDPNVDDAYCRLTLLHAAFGDTVDDTARYMGVSPSTVRSYRQRVLHELDARNITHAVAKAIRKGIIA